MEDLGDGATEIPVNLNMGVLKKIVAWMEHAKDTPAVVVATPVNEDERKLPIADEYETKLCNELDDDGKVEMVLGANLLDIKYLLDILMVDIASLVKGQSREFLFFPFPLCWLASPPPPPAPSFPTAEELRKVLERTNKP